MMNRFMISMLLALLSVIGEARSLPSIFADEPPADLQQAARPSSKPDSVDETPQRPPSSAKDDASAIKRDIGELHEDVRGLRGDVNRLIKLLETQPKKPKSNTDPTSAANPANESNPSADSVSTIQMDWRITLNEAVCAALQNSRALSNFGVVFSRLDASNIQIDRMNPDIVTTEVAIAARNLVSDVENVYWKLWANYRDLETARIGRDSAQTIWKTIYEKVQGGIESVQTEQQAREQYFFFRAQVESAQRDLHNTEGHLRLLMSLTARDGRLIRPKDDPPTTEVKLDWSEAHANALAKDFELIQQRQVVQRCAIKLEAARNALPKDLQNQLGVTTGNDKTIGERKALAEVRQLELGLAREKARLEDLELNTSHLVSTAFRERKTVAALSQTHLNRAVTAKQEVETATTLLRGGKISLDLVLDAQRRLAQAEKDYHRSIEEHAIAVKDVNLRIGTLLEDRGLKFAEALLQQTK
jgi:hypothetical protein